MSDPIQKRSPGDVAYHNQMGDNIRSVVELTTRIDERVQLMTRKLEDLERRVDVPIDGVNLLGVRVSVLESKTNNKLDQDVTELRREIRDHEGRIKDMEGTTNRSGERFKQVMSFVIQLVWVVIASWVLYKLHLSMPEH